MFEVKELYHPSAICPLPSALRAKPIKIFPLLQYTGFIFFDNGTGISSVKEINGITPIDAFFSIGMSTKTLGSTIGYKCQGSKLCFASQKFALITRCGAENEPYWRIVIIDNPRDTLDVEKDCLEIVEVRQPWYTLKQLLSQPDTRTLPILEHLDEDFFNTQFQSGTLILVKGLEVEDFPNYYATSQQEYSYLKTYIKFFTRHGDVRILNPKKTGFKEEVAENFKSSSPTYNDQCKLWLWNTQPQNEMLEEIPVGYPYIHKSDSLLSLDLFSPKSPQEIKRLSSGRFSDRIAQMINYNGSSYCLILAIDGNRKALDYYDDLARQGKKKSGIPFSSQRGTFICSEGIKRRQEAGGRGQKVLKEDVILNPHH